jgi:hypothetical protein
VLKKLREREFSFLYPYDILMQEDVACLRRVRFKDERLYERIPVVFLVRLKLRALSEISQRGNLRLPRLRR